jgi:phenylacetate-CoA ligase
MSRVRGALWMARLAAGGSAVSYLREHERFQTYGAEEVRQRQRALLAATLLHAHEHVPYYRRVLSDCGVVDGGKVLLDRFTDVPVLEKATLREHFDDLRADDADPSGLLLNTTGGSTGEPVRFLQDRATHDWKVATKVLFNAWAGIRPGARTLVLWGSEKDLAQASRSAASRVGAWLRNEIALNAFHMTEADMRAYTRAHNAFRPEFVLAYAQSIYQWARFIEAADLQVAPPKAIMTSATNLEPDMRATIERVFGARVYDRYGSREVGDIACENGDGMGLLVAPRTQFVEVVDAAGRPVPPGELGDVVVTLLTNRAMPLIRYRIGDAARMALGPVGDVAWPRLTEIAGRVTDIFYTADGEQVYGGYFTRMFYRMPSVAQFQIVQEAYDHMVLRIVPSRQATEAGLDAELSEATAKIGRVMGLSCRVDVERVDTIAPGPTGKRRYTISHVGPPSGAVTRPTDASTTHAGSSTSDGDGPGTVVTR